MKNESINEVNKPIPPHGPFSSSNNLDRVKNIIAIASGKGGVGKSTVATNLSIALEHSGAKVGLLDADIYGPSIPLMLGRKMAHPQPTKDGQMSPVENYGIKLMSVGFIVKPGQAVVWRGPMIHKILSDFFNAVNWGELDYLIIDLPPGTGDAQLSLSQLIPLTGAVVVTTPQEVALSDVEKAVDMFKMVNIPILGVIENMSTFICPHCEKETAIFAKDGGKLSAIKWGASVIGEIPLFTEIREGGDVGKPIVAIDPTAKASLPFIEIANNLINILKTTSSVKIKGI
jgi:ATP-binding protein involved in chromosome partitioning